MSRPGRGYTVGQLMVAVLVGALALGLYIVVDEAIRRERLLNFPPAPPLPPTKVSRPEQV